MSEPATPTLSELWANSHVKEAPVYEWPEWFLEIVAAFDHVSIEAVHTRYQHLPKPTQEITVAWVMAQLKDL